MEQHKWTGSNAEVEKSFAAPKINRGGRSGMSRSEAAADLLEKTGGFGTGATVDQITEAAKAVGRARTTGGEKRGTCQRCGAHGHTTRECRNDLAGGPNGTWLSDIPTGPVRGLTRGFSTPSGIEAGGSGVGTGPTLSDITLDSDDWTDSGDDDANTATGKHPRPHQHPHRDTKKRSRDDTKDRKDKKEKKERKKERRDKKERKERRSDRDRDRDRDRAEREGGRERRKGREKVERDREIREREGERGRYRGREAGRDRGREGEEGHHRRRHRSRSRSHDRGHDRGSSPRRSSPTA